MKHTCRRTYILKLLPNVQQHIVLKELCDLYTSAYNDCMSFLHEFPNIKSITELHREVYYELRDTYPGLNADYVSQAIRTAFRTMKSQKALRARGYKTASKLIQSRLQAPGLTRHLFTFYKVGNIVSIATPKGRQRMKFQVRDVLVENFKVCESRLVYDKKHDRFFMHVTISFEVELKPTKNIIGVDLGVHDACVTYSDKTNFEIISDRNLINIDLHYQKLRSDLQAKGTRSSKRRLKAISAKQKRLRRDVDHCISKSLIEYCMKHDLDTIVLENLTGIRKNMRSGKKVNRKNHMWTFRRLSTFIEYKAYEQGLNVVRIDPKDTSITCPVCGNIDKKNRMSQEQFACTKCNLVANADQVAAYNIQRKFLATQVAPGAVSLPQMQ